MGPLKKPSLRSLSVICPQRKFLDRIHLHGDVAQLGERRVRNAKVGSSILLVSTISSKSNVSPLFFAFVETPIGAGPLHFMRRALRSDSTLFLYFLCSLRSLFSVCAKGVLRMHSRISAGFRLKVLIIIWIGGSLLKL